MCEFFSVISDGKGKTLFFTVEDIAKIMSSGNKYNYNWNSHTSIAHFNGIKGANEDKWNKWEYNCDKKELKVDKLNNTDDREQVKTIVEKYLTTDNTIYLRNFYNRNTGHRNTGHRNAGHRNTGDRNTGHSNTGDRNTGDRNAGHSNTGDRNTGHRNTGHRNTGDRNTGDRNTGHSNTGDWNTGDWNTGCFNTKTPDKILVFNKMCSRKKWDNAQKPAFLWFNLTLWVDYPKMTEEEKKADLLAEMRGGYLKKLDYKEAFQASYAKATEKDKALLLKLPNFNKKVFYEISGIKL